MTRVYYEIGPELGDGLVAVQTLDVIPDLTASLPAGSYWIDRVTVRESWDPEEGWIYRRTYDPHGRLEVKGPGHFRLLSLAAEHEPEPGFFIV